MGKGYYGKEPFDLRLTVLRMLRQLPLIAGFTVLGSLLFGGGYYVRNVLLGGERLYSVTSRYRVDYAVEEEKDVGTVYINEVSWNTYLQTDLLQNALRKHLTDMSETEGTAVTPENLNPAESIKAVLASDLRVLATVVTTDSPEKSIRTARALEEALTVEFAEEIREITDIEVIEAGDSAQEVIPDIRVGRAFGLSAVLSCFFIIMVLLLKETGDDSIRLPSSLKRCYGLKTVGTAESRELPENMEYFFPQGTGQVALCASGEEVCLEEVLETLRKKCAGRKVNFDNWVIVKGDPAGGNLCAGLRQADGILLAVPAGSHEGRRLERVLEHLEQQDCRVTAALLWGADEKLLRLYFRGK